MSQIIEPSIVKELNANTPVHLTDAGRFLGLPSVSGSKAPEETNGERSDQDSSRQSSTPDDAPQGEPETTGPSLFEMLVNGVTTVLQNTQLHVNFGPPDMAAPGPAWQFHPYTGPFGEC